ALLAPFGYCQIVFAGLLGLLIFTQVPDSTSLAGIAIICLSGLGAAWMQRGK
ncbi:MAG TPA: EamA/RhaT family transporter, partial [Pseudomonas sp.]|nr:EamA/RhaT family transporter [Pseudomonas sp.]